jgi:segregation and condensation protein B
MGGEHETTGNNVAAPGDSLEPEPLQPLGELPLPVNAMVESLLFVADTATELERIAGALALEVDAVQQAIQELAGEYEDRGIRLQQKGKRVQLVTAPETAPYVRRFLGLELTGRLSPAALETLAIVAYRQPVTRSEVESIRGVNSDSVMRTLVNRGLVEEVGRLEQVGRPIIYGTSFEFLQQFGLISLEQLPPLELNGDLAAAYTEIQEAGSGPDSEMPSELWPEEGTDGSP